MAKTPNQPAPVQCRSCRGTGNCSQCYGDGRTGASPGAGAVVLDRDGRELPPEGVLCHRCKGNGVCVGCAGSGWVWPK